MDAHRPVYHFLPPANWINDPNGLIQWRDEVHLFYQHNPDAPQWGNMHWGHAFSRDLVRWQHLPVALAPTPGGPDQDGVWSGCAVDRDGEPVLLYTGRVGETENVCLATSRDGLRTWQKHPGNPVIPGPPPGLDQTGFRDPYVWRDGDGWRMVIGSGERDAGGAILQYASPDLERWTYLGPLLTGDLREQEPVWTGEMWECPNFFPLPGDPAGRHMLIISPMGFAPSRSLYTLYMLGAYDGDRFTPDTLAKLDGGDLYYYAPQAFLDRQGRRIAFGWAREARTDQASLAAGWAGVLTLPRLLSAGPDGALHQQPVPELEALRGPARTWEDLTLLPGDAPADAVMLEGLSGDTLELEVVFDLGEAGSLHLPAEFGLLLRRSPAAEEVTRVAVDTAGGRLVVDTLRSSLSVDAWPGEYEIPLDLEGQSELRLRVFLDRSILEVFANETAAITARLYPSRADSQGIALYALHSPARVARLQLWPMGSIW
jgi:beta-fructofuranosidase